MQKRKKRTMTYLIQAECMTDFMEEMIDNFIKLSIQGIQLHFVESGKSQTKISYSKGINRKQTA